MYQLRKINFGVKWYVSALIFYKDKNKKSEKQNFSDFLLKFIFIYSFFHYLE